MIIFLDFDGVIINSIEECYVVSREVYYGHALFAYQEKEYKEVFYKHRGLVGPSYEYRTLHRSIELYLKDNTKDVESEFKKLTLKNTTKEEDFFEKKFFYLRGLYMEKNFDAWLALNPLTKFGETLVNRSNPDIYIVTTKNKEATKALLEYYRIGVGRIYANDEIKQAGSKGNLLSRVMDEASKQDAIFIDDAVQHLNTVADNRIKCFFANWGYGTNNGYPIYKWK